LADHYFRCFFCDISKTLVDFFAGLALHKGMSEVDDQGHRKENNYLTGTSK